jgi:phosphatidylserine decarboxylase
MTFQGLLQIELYNRQTRRVEAELVPGRQLLGLCYGHPWGRHLSDWVVSRPIFSRIYGWPLHQTWSRRQIRTFVRQYQVNMSEVEVPHGGFQSFNDFFIRRLKPGARPLPPDPAALISPADSRLKVLQLNQETILQVKGASLTLSQLLGTATAARIFSGGLCLQFRLAPSDYHRFGFIESGIQGPIHTVGGRLYSVSPIALRYLPDVWGRNYRQWCLIGTPSLGTVLQIEVGATVVGSIIQHQPDGGPCTRGAEKGYFAMGGSTVLVVLPPGRVTIDDDILSHSQQGIETLVRYGEKIGRIRPLDLQNGPINPL